MRRFLTHTLLVLSAFVLVTGGLVRPCDCAAEGETSSTCCCPCDVSENEAPTSSGEDEGEGCTLCCKPRPPYATAESGMALDAPALLGFAHPGATSAFHEGAPHPTGRALLQHRPTTDPWLLSQAGLTVFLI